MKNVREKIKCIILAASVLFLFSALTASMVCGSPVGGKPAYIYLTWATPDTAHTINVSWRTDENYIGEVRYDNEPHDGDPEAYAYHTEGDLSITPVTLKGTGGYIHHVELTGLKSGTKYYFICGHPDYCYSDEHSFRTAPVDRENVRFIVGGDSRSNKFFHPPNPDWPGARDKITQLAASYNPDFINFNGDFLSSGEEQRGTDTWDNWLGAWYKYARADDGSLIPMVPVIGNHELVFPQPGDYDPETEASNYYAVFNLPGNERWYSLDWGPDLHFIVLDSEILNTESKIWNEQLEWLENDLWGNRDCLWKIIFFHRPAYSSGEHGGELLHLEDWLVYFDICEVDVAFASHDHGYERAGPINHTQHPGELMDSPENGTIYVVTAGWGAELYEAYDENKYSWFTAPDSPGRLGKAENFYHCVIIDLGADGTFHLQAVSHEGEVVDNYSFQKEVPGEDVESAFPTSIIVAVVVVIAMIGVALFFTKRRE